MRKLTVLVLVLCGSCGTQPAGSSLPNERTCPTTWYWDKFLVGFNPPPGYGFPSNPYPDLGDLGRQWRMCSTCLTQLDCGAASGIDDLQRALNLTRSLVAVSPDHSLVLDESVVVPQGKEGWILAVKSPFFAKVEIYFRHLGGIFVVRATGWESEGTDDLDYLYSIASTVCAD